MGQRAYRRDSHGRFAGSGGGSMTTYGKAGGFANKAFASRSAAANKRAKRNAALSSLAKKTLIRGAVAGGTVAAISLSDPATRNQMGVAIGNAAADNRASRSFASSRGLGAPTRVTKKSIGGTYKITTARTRAPRSNRARVSTGRKMR